MARRASRCCRLAGATTLEGRRECACPHAPCSCKQSIDIHLSTVRMAQAGRCPRQPYQWCTADRQSRDMGSVSAMAHPCILCYPLCFRAECVLEDYQAPFLSTTVPSAPCNKRLACRECKCQGGGRQEKDRGWDSQNTSACPA